MSSPNDTHLIYRTTPFATADWWRGWDATTPELRRLRRHKMAAEAPKGQGQVDPAMVSAAQVMQQERTARARLARKSEDESL